MLEVHSLCGRKVVPDINHTDTNVDVTTPHTWTAIKKDMPTIVKFDIFSSQSIFVSRTLVFTHSFAELSITLILHHFLSNSGGELSLLE